MGFFKRKKETKTLYSDLKPTKNSLGQKIRSLFSKPAFDNQFFEEMEETLVMADVSVETTVELIDRFKKEIAKKKLSIQEGIEFFEKLIVDFLPDNNFDIEENNLNIIFVFGVNGVGKTTSIAKIAQLFKNEGFSILIAAADTYRAAASDQLSIWAERVGVPIVQHQGKSKPSAVIYDAIESALAKKIQILIVDTAGRLHNKENLMEELKKLNKILSEKAPKAKKYNLLVVDATTGQNAVQQTKNFNESVGINGVFLSKMDSTAKGGIAITLAHQLNIPVVFIGTGEKIDHIEYFDKTVFVRSIFE